MADVVLSPSPASVIEATLADLRTPAQVVSTQAGPRFTRFGLRPERGVRVARLLRLGPDLALALGVESVRLDPAADAVGLEVPRTEPEAVPLAPLLAEAQWPRSALAVALGRDVAGRPHVVDLARLPHLLVAGATGSGKSVAVNALLASLLSRSGPAHLRLALIDAKRVELATYAGLPHLWRPLATEVGEAEALLADLVAFMEARYRRLTKQGARSIDDLARPWYRVVCVVDELADLVMGSKPARAHLIRLAQKSRAAGIHPVLATQRPSADVISGLLKANVPGRLAFATTSAVDSRVVLDASGAEALLGKGDLLFKPPWALEPVRLQGAYVSDAEIRALVARWTPPPEPEPAPSDSQEPAGRPLWPAALVFGLLVALLVLALLGLSGGLGG